jgi:hypothetical protein
VLKSSWPARLIPPYGPYCSSFFRNHVYTPIPSLLSRACSPFVPTLRPLIFCPSFLASCCHLFGEAFLCFKVILVAVIGILLVLSCVAISVVFKLYSFFSMFREYCTVKYKKTVGWKSGSAVKVRNYCRSGAPHKYFKRSRAQCAYCTVAA